MRNIELYNEQECLLRAASGDEAAFRQLFDRYHHLLSLHIFRLTESRQMADDIVQDVFIKVWLIRESLAEIKHFRTWLHTIARNQALDTLRQVARQRVRHQQFEQSFVIDTEGYDPVFLDIVDQAIAALPPQQKKAYLLSRHEKLRYEDIALEMGISQETVKYYMKLALASIIKMIKEQAGFSVLMALFYNI